MWGRLSTVYRPAGSWARPPVVSSSASCLLLRSTTHAQTLCRPHWPAVVMSSSRSFAAAAASQTGTAGASGSKKKKKPQKNKNIKVVLTEDVPGLGVKGEDIEVAKGYARNFLFPKKYAVYCTEENYKLYEAERANIDYEKRERMQELAKAKKRLSKVLVVMKRQVVQTEPTQVLHAPVYVPNIVEKLWMQHKIQLRPEQITLDAPITQIGTFSVPVRLEDLDVALKVQVQAR